MTTHDKITEARLVNGKVYVKQAGGTYEETASQTDWARVDATTDEEIERQAEEDGDNEWFPDDLEPVRVVRPYEPAE
jgi:hypothetical protein